MEMVLRPFTDKRTQGAKPGFVVSPTFDRSAIDRLPSLPLARCFDCPGISLVSQTGVVPRQAARCDHAPDDWFRRAGQFLIVHFDKAIRRQNTPPMISEALVAAEVLDQIGTSGRKGESQMKMSLMDR